MQTSPVNGVDRSLGCPLVGACSGAMLRCGAKVLSPVSRFILMLWRWRRWWRCLTHSVSLGLDTDIAREQENRLPADVVMQ